MFDLNYDPRTEVYSRTIQPAASPGPQWFENPQDRQAELDRLQRTVDLMTAIEPSGQARHEALQNIIRSRNARMIGAIQDQIGANPAPGMTSFYAPQIRDLQADLPNRSFAPEIAAPPPAPPQGGESAASPRAQAVRELQGQMAAGGEIAPAAGTITGADGRPQEVPLAPGAPRPNYTPSQVPSLASLQTSSDVLAYWPKLVAYYGPATAQALYEKLLAAETSKATAVTAAQGVVGAAAVKAQADGSKRTPYPAETLQGVEKTSRRAAATNQYIDQLPGKMWDDAAKQFSFQKLEAWLNEPMGQAAGVASAFAQGGGLTRAQFFEASADLPKIYAAGKALVEAQKSRAGRQWTASEVLQPYKTDPRVAERQARREANLPANDTDRNLRAQEILAEIAKQPPSAVQIWWEGDPSRPGSGFRDQVLKEVGAANLGKIQAAVRKKAANRQVAGAKKGRS